jgi:hypothetical protein
MDQGGQAVASGLRSPGSGDTIVASNARPGRPPFG